MDFIILFIRSKCRTKYFAAIMTVPSALSYSRSYRIAITVIGSGPRATSRGLRSHLITVIPLGINSCQYL